MYWEIESNPQIFTVIACVFVCLLLIPSSLSLGTARANCSNIYFEACGVHFRIHFDFSCFCADFERKRRLYQWSLVFLDIIKVFASLWVVLIFSFVIRSSLNSMDSLLFAYPKYLIWILSFDAFCRSVLIKLNICKCIQTSNTFTVSREHFYTKKLLQNDL